MKKWYCPLCGEGQAEGKVPCRIKVKCAGCGTLLKAKLTPEAIAVTFTNAAAEKYWLSKGAV